MKRADKPVLADALGRTQPVVATLALMPLDARIATSCGFPFVYLSGGALGYAFGVSEALLSIDEIAAAARRIDLYSEAGVIVDIGVGFGDPVHVARTIVEVEAAGAVAVELEDQVAPKRVSHHRGIEHLVDTDMMVAKISQAVAARSRDDMLIIARTGAVSNESFSAALERLDAYRAAGADVLMLMPQDRKQIESVRERFDCPLATITAMDSLHTPRWQESGWDLFIDPFTSQVVSVRSVEAALAGFSRSGATGSDLRELFEDYHRLDKQAGLEPLYRIEDMTTEKQETVETKGR